MLRGNILILMIMQCVNITKLNYIFGSKSLFVSKVTPSITNHKRNRNLIS